MKKNFFNLDDYEKNRILEMHKMVKNSIIESKSKSNHGFISENVSVASPMLTKLLGISDDAFRAFGQQGLDDLIRLVGTTNKSGGIKFYVNTKGGVKEIIAKNTDEIAKLAKKGATIGAQDAGALKVLSLSDDTFRASPGADEIIVKMTDTKYIKGLTTEKDIATKLVEKGLTQNAADDVAKRIMNFRKSGKISGASTKSSAAAASSKTTKKMPNTSSSTRANTRVRLRWSTMTQSQRQRGKQIVENVAKKQIPWLTYVTWAAGIGITGLGLWWLWGYFTDEEPPVPPPVDDSYKNCPGPQYKMYCISETIRQVQKCLEDKGIDIGSMGADGKLGPITDAALRQVYPKYATNNFFTQDEVAEICGTTSIVTPPVDQTTIEEPPKPEDFGVEQPNNLDISQQGGAETGYVTIDDI